jgi:hypothetical protein
MKNLPGLNGLVQQSGKNDSSEHSRESYDSQKPTQNSTNEAHDLSRNHSHKRDYNVPNPTATREFLALLENRWFQLGDAALYSRVAAMARRGIRDV